MHTTPKERIDDLTARGLWGTDTLHSLLRGWAESTPEALAVADQHNRAELTGDEPLRLNFRQLDAASDALAADLLSMGIGADSFVMVQLPNICELVICYYAISKIGAVITPIPVQYGTHEISSLASNLKPDAFLSIREFHNIAMADIARNTLPDTQVLVFGKDIHIRALDAVDEEARTVVARNQEKFPIDANRTLSICLTSGTTGTPKGVPRSHNMWIATGLIVALGSGFEKGEILLNPFPMVNMSALGGFLFPAVLVGCGIVLHHPINPPIFLQQMQQEAINFTIAPPPLLNKLAQEPDLWNKFDFSALRAIGSGSAPLSPDMIATFERDYGVTILNIYGSNEGIALISTPGTAPDPEVRAAQFPRSGVEGMPWKGSRHENIQTKVIDTSSGKEVTGKNEKGELCFGGPTVFDGYFGHADDDLFTEDGYFHTGDLVEICGDDSQYYRIAGRCKDIINRGGVKISPSELDTLLEGYPGLAEVAVAAYPDSILGEKVCAFVVPAPETDSPSLEAICDYLMERGIAKFKLPERVEVIGALPRNPVGKILRHELRVTV